MADVFSCPHCGTTYPIKPVLIGRAVRCTGCRGGFQLGSDGVAIPVEIEGGDNLPSRPTAGTREPTRSGVYSPHTEVQITAASPAQTESLYNQAALISSRERPGSREEDSSGDYQPHTESYDDESGNKLPTQRIDPAVASVVGSGEGQALPPPRTRSSFPFGLVLMVVGLVCGLGLALGYAALNAKSAPEVGALEATLRGAATPWIANESLPREALEGAQVQVIRELSWSPAAEEFSGGLLGMRLLTDPGIWVPAEEFDRVIELWRDGDSLIHFQETLAELGVQSVLHGNLDDRLVAKGMEATAADLFSRFARIDTYRERFAAGDIPLQVEIAYIEGLAGASGPLKARLVRFDGGPWAGFAQSHEGWRVLDVHIGGGSPDDPLW